MSRSYLQHARRHLPTGSDPIPGLTSTPQLPSAYYSASAVPLTTFPSTGNRVDLDTIDATNDATTFGLTTGVAELSAGFYLAFVYVQFHTPADWSSHTSAIGVTLQSSGAHFRTQGTATTSPPSYIGNLNLTDYLNIGAGTETVWIIIGFTGTVVSPPQPIDVVYATFTRLSDSI